MMYYIYKPYKDTTVYYSFYDVYFWSERLTNAIFFVDLKTAKKVAENVGGFVKVYKQF